MSVDPLEVMFVKVKSLLLQPHRTSYALKAAKYDEWMVRGRAEGGPLHCTAHGAALKRAVWACFEQGCPVAVVIEPPIARQRKQGTAA